ncbi:hypothetical protein MIR68_011373 [Amoeboaphelidium protococcarum]|nr:hypothetical protein MIR68_011373 [Amoeboaphelidium protococcarum]
MNSLSNVSESTSSSDVSQPPYSKCIRGGEQPLPYNCDPRNFPSVTTTTQGPIVSMQHQPVRDASFNGRANNLVHPHQFARPQQRPLIDQISCYYCQKYNKDYVLGKRCEHQMRVITRNERLNLSQRHDTQSTRQQNIDDGEDDDDDEDLTDLSTIMRLRDSGDIGHVPRQFQTVAPHHNGLGTRQQNQPLVAMIPQQPIVVVRVQTRTRYRGSVSRMLELERDHRHYLT